VSFASFSHAGPLCSNDGPHDALAGKDRGRLVATLSINQPVKGPVFRFSRWGNFRDA